MSILTRKFMVIASAEGCKCRVTAYRFSDDERVQLLTVYECKGHELTIQKLGAEATLAINEMSRSYDAGSQTGFFVGHNA